MYLSRVSTCLAAVVATLAPVSLASPAAAVDAPPGFAVLDTATLYPPENGSRVCQVTGTPPEYSSLGGTDGYWYGRGRATCTDHIEDIHLHVNIYCYDSDTDTSAEDCGVLDDRRGTMDVPGTGYYFPDGIPASYVRTHVAAVFTFDRPAPELGGWCSNIAYNQVVCYYRSEAVPTRQFSGVPALS